MKNSVTTLTLLALTLRLCAQSVEPFWHSIQDGEISLKISGLSEDTFTNCLNEQDTFQVKVNLTFCKKKGLKLKCKSDFSLLRSVQKQRMLKVFIVKEDIIGDKQHPIIHQRAELQFAYRDFVQPFLVRIPASATHFLVEAHFVCENTPRMALENYLPFLSLKRIFSQKTGKILYQINR